MAISRASSFAHGRPREQFEALLERAAKANIEDLSGSCADILAHRAALWTFLDQEGGADQQPRLCRVPGYAGSAGPARARTGSGRVRVGIILRLPRTGLAGRRQFIATDPNRTRARYECPRLTERDALALLARWVATLWPRTTAGRGGGSTWGGPDYAARGLWIAATQGGSRATMTADAAQSGTRHNHAEQELRTFVMWRKRCFGSQSERGNLFAERMMTIAHTARKQGINVLEMVVACYLARAKGTASPSLFRPRPAPV